MSVARSTPPEASRAREAPERLYKCVPPDTLVSHILPSLTLRWSAPFLFNDPFDAQTDAMPDLWRPGLVEQLAGQIEPLVRNPDRFSEGYREALAESRRLCGPSSTPCQVARHMAKGVVSAWQEPTAFQGFASLSRLYRVLCLCAEPASIPMWSHYAKDHTGAVLVFDSMRLADHWRPQARNLHCVRYTEEPHSVIDPIKAIIAGMTGEDYWPTVEDCQKHFCTKSRAWEQEREWRFVTMPMEQPTELFENVPFPAAVLEGVILGCRCQALTADAVRWAL